MDESSIFLEALRKPSPEERAGFLDQACGGNAELRHSVELLLRAHDKAGGFLAPPPPPLGATVDKSSGEAAGTVIGPYKLIEEIGEGGMGTVWMAQQTEPVKRLVAVKLIKAGMDTKQVLARFEAERQALALMDHPNIARVLEAGTTGAGRPYFVMDLVKGMPITTYCDEHRLTLRQRLELFVPVCLAVQHAHQKGVIHRDLKPSNVLVALYDGRPVPKVIDFGVAKATGQALTDKTLVTGFGAIVGTLEYMSPEQAEVNQLDIDTRSDIYSLGVLLYELLAGSPPFTRKDLETAGVLEMLRVIREQEPSKPSTKLSTAEGLPTLAANRGAEPGKLTRLVRGELDWIVMKALEKDRNRRYETANGFAADVQRYLADEAVFACPPSNAYRLKKLVRRNKRPVLAVSLVLLALVVGVVATAWQAVRADRARLAEIDRAEGERVAKERAEANFALANEAVETYLGTVTNDKGLKRADFHQLRRKLLESAIPFLQRLTAQKSDDPEIEARRGRAHGLLGDVRQEMGEKEVAVQDYEAERAIFDHLATNFPEVAAYRQQLAISHNNTGIVLQHLAKRSQAEAAFRRALDIREKLVAQFPGERMYRQDLADSHNSLGVLLDDLGDQDRAEKAYRQALDIRAKLVDEFPEVRAYRHDLASIQSNLGTLLNDLGRDKEAEPFFRQAVKTGTELVDKVPDKPEYRQDLASSQTNLGLLLARMRKPEKAETHFRQAIANLEKLAADFPTVPEYRQELAGSLINLSTVLDDLEKDKESVAALRQAVATQEKLAKEFPTVPTNRQRLAAGLNNLGLKLNELGQSADAEAAFLRVIAIGERLVADFPKVQAHAVELGGAYCNYGNWARGNGQAEAALGWYQKGIATLTPVVAKEPRLVEAKAFLCNAHGARAGTLDNFGRYAEAARDWERALELDDDSKKANYRLRISRGKKDAAGCLAAAAENEALMPANAGALYDAACNRALCAAVIPQDSKTPAAAAPRLAKEQADLAMAWLRKAVAAGFKDAVHMKLDKDLDALRGREDFKKLLAEVERRQKESGDKNQGSEKKSE